MSVIFTIGYEGATIDDFVATLLKLNISFLIDIRDVPISRKRGFSKKSLSSAVNEKGIQYLHFRELGDPKQGREAARRGDIKAFYRIYRSHLNDKNAQEALEKVIQLTISGENSCLLCFERDPRTCHRLIVAEEMAKREEFEIRHAGVRRGLANEARHDEGFDRTIHAFG